MKIYKRTKHNKDNPYVAHLEKHHKDGSITIVTKKEWFALRTKQFALEKKIFNHQSQSFLDAL